MIAKGQTRYRNHWIQSLKSLQSTDVVYIAGWVERIRDHGGLIFVDMWDHTGSVQLVFEPARAELFKMASELKKSYVIGIEGELRQRPLAKVQDDILGCFEVEVREMVIFNESVALPFDRGEAGISDEIRMRHRFLDLRDPIMHYRLRMRATIISMMRSYLEMQGFLDVETPILTKATPEGARDYLVPSRTYPGHCFALPQSPQIFKQLLMCSGFDRYYQVARCFRDEDLRSDRQPEFTQLDLEMAFVDEKDVMQLVEGMVRHVFKSILNVDLGLFPVMRYQEAMDRYGCDRPDLTFEMLCTQLNDCFRDSEIAMIQSVLESGGDWMGLCLKSQDVSRRVLDELTDWVRSMGCGGLVWIKINEDGIASPIAKWLDEKTIASLISTFDAAVGDVIFIMGGPSEDVRTWVGRLRLHLAQVFAIERRAWAPLWVVDFPMFDRAEDHSLQAMHHPFTTAQDWDMVPDGMVARAYDFVLNGYEIGGGSVRIHQYDRQMKVFEYLGLSQEIAHEQFEHLLSALRMGAPPHAGLALGLDRLIMVMCGAATIRDVIAFPKTQSASCLLTHAPSIPSKEALDELSIRMIVPKKGEDSGRAQ